METYTATIYIENDKAGRPRGRVDPEVVTLDLKKKDEVEWTLVSPDYPDASANIEPKQGNDWPFDTDPPKKIKKEPKKSGPPKAAAKYKNQYKVVCTLTDGPKPTVFTIDPDIIIIGGAIDS